MSDHLNKIDLLIHGYRLVLTCLACPEQYDVFDQSGNMVAYLRLRHGRFTVTVPDVGGKLILSVTTDGDGAFTRQERMKKLNLAIEAIQDHYFSAGIEELTDY